MSEAQNLRYCRTLKNTQHTQVSGLCDFPQMSYSSKCLTEIYRAQYLVPVKFRHESD